MKAPVAIGRYLPRPGAEPSRRHVLLDVGEEEIRIAGSSIDGRGLLAMPAPVNAHDHGYGIRTLDFGCMDDALETWVPWMRLRPPTDPYLEALVAFGRVAKSGCGATMHCHNSLNAASLVEEAADVVRAARDCGIRLALSCPLLDESPFVYGGLAELLPDLDEADRARIGQLAPKYHPIPEQLAAVEEVARNHAGGMVDVQYGPIGPQWASNALLEAIAEASALTGRRVHMHLLESPRQRTWLDRRFPQGIVRYLDEIGFLSPRLAVAHGVQLRADECELLAERGVILVSNPSANLRLRSGIAPLGDVRRAELKYALGLDGTGFDDDQDIWRELRLFSLLHGGRGLDPDIPAEEVFAAMHEGGCAVVNHPARRDVVVVDYAALTADAIFDDEDEAAVLLGRMTARHVKELHVAGQQIVGDGKLMTVDYDAALRELVNQARSVRPMLEARRSDAEFLSQIVRRHYATRYS
ncbi:amidohydrolase family protein [Aquibium sp. LZ166]|uniref:Amidohydrolase family protein n=1 Tax=Aquibium pacificus TaxID=3153579 RepID=A0ABV3SL61_9HYPH